MPITLTPEQITQAVAEDATRGLLPKLVQGAANSGELYVDLNDNPAIVTKYTENGTFDAAKLRNAVKQAIKNTSDKIHLAGGDFPEMVAVVHQGENGDSDHVLIVNAERLAAAQAASDEGEL
jgi:hypothetical protein